MLFGSKPSVPSVSKSDARRWSPRQIRDPRLSLSVNLVLTLSSIAFTCYSLHRFDSRLTAVEQNLLLTSSPYQLADQVTAQPKFGQSHPNGPQIKEDARVKRAANSQSMCRKCSNACLKSIGHRNVSYFAYMLEGSQAR